MANKMVRGYKATITSPMIDVKWLGVRSLNISRGLDEVAGKADSGGSVALDYQRRYEPHFTERSATVLGVVQDDSAGTISSAKGVDIKLTSSAVIPGVSPYEWTLRRTWPLTDITGGGDGAAPSTNSRSVPSKSYAYGMPVTSLSMKTWVTTTMADLMSDDFSIEISMDLVGKLTYNGTTGKAIVVRSETGFSKRDGFIGMSYDILLDGFGTYADPDGVETYHKNVLLDETNDFATPPEGDCIISLPDSATASNILGVNAIINDVAYFVNRRAGSAIFVSASHTWSDDSDD